MYDYAEVSLDSSPDNWGDVPNATPYTVGTPAAVLADTIVIPFNDAATRKDFSGTPATDSLPY